MMMKSGSGLEQLLADQMQLIGLPYAREYRAIAGRRFRFDFVIGEPDKDRLLVEVQGGIWMRGKSGHSSGRGLARDYEKYNLAVLQGWRVLLMTREMIESGRAVSLVAQALLSELPEEVNDG